MALLITNTLNRKRQKFTPLRSKEVRLYTCGPTVWDFAHIGNLRTFTFQDVLRRYLERKGFRVKQVMNITDVDDKTIRGARSLGIPFKEYTTKYENAFFEDLSTLNIKRAEVYPRATEHVDDMVALIKRLLESGYAYRADGSVYFDISKFRNYGRLSGVKLKELRAGARVDVQEYGKDEAADFALWKGWDVSDGDIFWETELGKGRPGWHIECSAMSMKYLGEMFDIHSGGEDLVFPHHENEIAQSEAVTKKPLAKYWVHGAFLLVNGQKMSKSLGNIVTLRDLTAKGHDPRAIRLLFLSGHYKSQLNFTDESLRSAERTVRRLYDFMTRITQIFVIGKPNAKLSRSVRQARRAFFSSMDDDLNSPQALAAIFQLETETNRAMNSAKASRKNLNEVCDAFQDFDNVLGVIQFSKAELPRDAVQLIRDRERARELGDWKSADRIREALLQRGISIEDTPSGVVWKITMK